MVRIGLHTMIPKHAIVLSSSYIENGYKKNRFARLQSPATLLIHQRVLSVAFFSQVLSSANYLYVIK